MKRYPGIRPFSTDESDRFFGRDQDIERLWRLIRLEQVVILYGKSGYGKSSLLSAGIYPKLAPGPAEAIPGKRYQHWDLRFGPYQPGQSRRPAEALRSLVLRDSVQNGGPALFPADQFGATLWQALKSQQGESRRFILFFDQFEEIFSYPTEQVQEFKTQLAEALYTAVPESVAEASLRPEQEAALNEPFELKVVFAIRADRMSQLNALQDYLPNLLRHSYRLDALDENQATEAVTAPALLPRGEDFDTEPFQYAASALALIFKELRDPDTGKIETSALQIVCRHVEDNLLAAQPNNQFPITIGAADLGDIKSIFRQFYDRTIAALPEAQQPVARHLVEDLLIKDGVRLPFAEQALLAERGVTTGLLQALAESSLLRVERDEQGRMLYEVGHDTLVAPVEEAAKTRREAEMQAAERRLLALEAERQQAEKQKIARARRRNFAFGIIGLLLVGWGLWQTRIAQQKGKLADERTAAAAVAERHVIEKDSLVRLAQIRADTAQALATRKTEEARQNADANVKAMLELGYSTARVVDAQLKEIKDNIYHLEYPEALGKLESVAQFKKPTFEFIHAALELAFYYNEIGERQTGALAQALALLGQPRARSQTACREYLRHEDRLWYGILMAKYYPVMVEVTGGEYYPGCVKPGDCVLTDSSYRVRISKFSLARTETTFHQYALYCQATGRKIFKDCGPLSWGFNGDNPVVNVSWFDACLYANWLSRQFEKQQVYKMGEPTKGGYGDNYPDITLDSSANGFRLPTEGEWEWAARGGEKQDIFEFAGDSIIENIAWYYVNSGNRTHPVATTKHANTLKIYDLSGNVWEWCWDWYGKYPTEPKTDWRGPKEGAYRVFRGGSWSGSAGYCRAAYRYNDSPTSRYSGLGFRLVRSF